MQGEVYGRLEAALAEHVPEVKRDPLRRLVPNGEALFGDRPTIRLPQPSSETVPDIEAAMARRVRPGRRLARPGLSPQS